MKSKPSTTSEYAIFSDALRRVLSVTPVELKSRMDAAKQGRADRRAEREKLLIRRAAAKARRGTSASARASGSKD